MRAKIFRRCGTISTKELAINDDIRVPQVRLIGSEGEQIGIVPVNDAKNMAYDKGLDLVLIAPQATPPVCRIMDYGKYRFERDKREKEAKKKQQVIEIKEIQLSCTIGDHDLETKVNHAKRFLGDGNKVKAIVRFKGREFRHMDIGRAVLDKFIAACAEYGTVDKAPVLEGRFMSVFISPVKSSS